MNPEIRQRRVRRLTRAGQDHEARDQERQTDAERREHHFLLTRPEPFAPQHRDPSADGRCDDEKRSH